MYFIIASLFASIHLSRKFFRKGMLAITFQKKNGAVSAFAKVVAANAVSMVLLLVWLSADPEAHEHFHHDADKGDHHCVVTEFAAGSGYYLVPQVALPPVDTEFGIAHFRAEEIIREAADFVLLPICGPPFNGISA